MRMNLKKIKSKNNKYKNKFNNNSNNKQEEEAEIQFPLNSSKNYICWNNKQNNYRKTY